MKASKFIKEWDAARALLAGMRFHSRRRLTNRILLGKTLKSIKTKLGTERGGNKGGPMAQFEPSAEKWDSLVREKLGISRVTANRRIRDFEYGCECAQAEDFSENFPAAASLLLRPQGELSETEIGELADAVEHLVDHMTAAALRIELGIEIEEDAKQAAAGPGLDSGAEQRALQVLANDLFSSVPTEFDELSKLIKKLKKSPAYRAMDDLPLDLDPDDENPVDRV